METNCMKPNYRSLIKPKKFKTSILLENLDNVEKELINFDRYKRWYYERRLKFLEEAIELVYGYQDILVGESMLYDIWSEEQKRIVEAIKNEDKGKNT